MPGIITSSSTASKVPGLERREPPRPVGRRRHVNAVLLEVAREQLVEPDVVVDEQHAEGHVHRRLPAGPAGHARGACGRPVKRLPEAHREEVQRASFQRGNRAPCPLTGVVRKMGHCRSDLPATR